MRFNFLNSKTLRDVSLGAFILGGVCVFASSAFGFEEEVKKQGRAFVQMALKAPQKVNQVAYNSLEEFKGLRFLKASSAEKIPGTGNIFLVSKDVEFFQDSPQAGSVYLHLWGLHEMGKKYSVTSTSIRSDAKCSVQTYRMLVTGQKDGLKSMEHLPGYFSVAGDYCIVDLENSFQVGTMLPLMQVQEPLFSQAREYYTQQNVPDASITNLNCFAFVLYEDKATRRALGDLAKIGETPNFEEGENVCAVKFLHDHLNCREYEDKKDLKPMFSHPHVYGYEDHFTPEGTLKISTALIKTAGNLLAELKGSRNPYCALRKKDVIKFLLSASMSLSETHLSVVERLLSPRQKSAMGNLEEISPDAINPYIIVRASAETSHYPSWHYFASRAHQFLGEEEKMMMQKMVQREGCNPEKSLEVPRAVTEKIEGIVRAIDALALLNGREVPTSTLPLYGDSLNNVTPSHVHTYMSQEEPDLALKRSAVVHLASFNNLNSGCYRVMDNMGCARTSDSSRYAYPEINPSDIEHVVRILKSQWGGPHIFSTPGFLEKSVLRNLDSIRKAGQNLLEEETKAGQKAL